MCVMEGLKSLPFNHYFNDDNFYSVISELSSNNNHNIDYESLNNYELLTFDSNEGNNKNSK